MVDRTPAEEPEQPVVWFHFAVFVFPFPEYDFEERSQDMKGWWSAVPSSRERMQFSGTQPVIAERPGKEQIVLGCRAVGTISKY